MEHKSACIALEYIFALKSKMYSFLADDSIQHKKAKCVSNNVAAAISHNEYKDVLSNKKCLSYSMGRIKSKNHRIRTYEIIKKISDKISFRTASLSSHESITLIFFSS